LFIFIPYLIKEFSVGRLLVFILIVGILGFLSYCLNTMRIVVYDDKFIDYKVVKHEFLYDKIESIELDKFGVIIVKYNNKTYKIRGILSALDQMPSEDKNQKLIDYINIKRNKEELVYTNTDEVSTDKDMTLF
jgi:hypothetical protein